MTRTLKQVIRIKETELLVSNLRLTVDRFDLEILKAKSEIERLELERSRSLEAMEQKLLEVKKLLEE